MAITLQESEQIASEVLVAETIISQIDIPLYKSALEQMQSNFSRREASTILSGFSSLTSIIILGTTQKKKPALG